VLYYTMTVECPHCRFRWHCAVEAEVEPPPGHAFEVVCPNDGGRHRVGFRYFRKVEQLPPDAHPQHYPPPPEPPAKRWWEFWKR
jgi:hypothetical protein